MSRTVVILTGEASGDLYGADLAESLRTRFPEITLHGVGGARMHAAGVQLIADSRVWGAIGIVQSVKVAPKALLAFQRVKRFLRHLRPDWVVPIDFGAFNVPLSCWAKAHGMRVAYYIPPGSWRRERQGADLPRCTDCVLTPFEWSATRLRALGAQAHWVPHPTAALSAPFRVEGGVLRASSA
jgi:lipid-A-disaccharide synthase